MKMQWEREEAMFMGVSLMVQLVSPRNSCRRKAQCSPMYCLSCLLLFKLEQTLGH